jgi:hypothetical protein
MQVLGPSSTQLGVALISYGGFLTSDPERMKEGMDMMQEGQDMMQGVTRREAGVNLTKIA